MKDRRVLVEMNAANKGQLLPIAHRVAADMKVVLSNTELAAEIDAANGSLREVMNPVERLAHCKQSLSTV